MSSARSTAGGSSVTRHFVSDGNQVMSMWSWLVFMRHNVEKRRSYGVPLPKPNLSEGFGREAVDFITRVSAEALAQSTPEAN